MVIQDPGIVHENVKMIDGLGDDLRSLVDTRLICDVDDQGCDSERKKSGCGFVDSILRSSGQKYPPLLCSQLPYHLEPDALVSTGHQGNAGAPAPPLIQ